MAETIAPRQILRDLLQGIPPARPLFVPIVFALGARVENLPLRAFLANSTKISNSLRQIRGPARADGVSCYFDPLLEAEALGGGLEWDADGQRPTLRWPADSEPGQLPAGLASPEDVLKRGRVPVALEVIRRLKALLREDSLLMVGVSGPFTLAARLTGLYGPTPVPRESLADSAIEVAAAAVMQLSKAFAETGANLVFIREEIFPKLQAEAYDGWASMLTPIFNIVRFYEALPLVQITADAVFAADIDVQRTIGRDCVICPSLEAVRRVIAEAPSRLQDLRIGISLLTDTFRPDQHGDPSFDKLLAEIIRDLRPAVVTTAEDLPASTDLKRLAAISEVVRLS